MMLDDDGSDETFDTPANTTVPTRMGWNSDDIPYTYVSTEEGEEEEGDLAAEEEEEEEGELVSRPSKRARCVLGGDTESDDDDASSLDGFIKGKDEPDSESEYSSSVRSTRNTEPEVVAYFQSGMITAWYERNRVVYPCNDPSELEVIRESGWCDCMIELEPVWSNGVASPAFEDALHVCEYENMQVVCPMFNPNITGLYTIVALRGPA